MEAVAEAAVVAAVAAAVVEAAAVVAEADITAHLALTRSASPAQHPRLAGDSR